MSVEKFLGDFGRRLVGGAENVKVIKQLLSDWEEEVDRRIEKDVRETEEAKRMLREAIARKLSPKRKGGNK